MKYNMTEPCNACPFLIGSGFTYKSLQKHASGEFACHKACDLDEDVYVEKASGKTPHCAGALIFLEKKNQPHQMMRIAERLRAYDRTKLNMRAPVVANASDCKRVRVSTDKSRSATFTQGPWEYRAFPTQQGVVFDISNTQTETGGVDVAYTYSHEANARLIAAAPELLAACQLFVEFEKTPCSDPVGCVLAQAKASEAIRAAIAKATGGAV